ncbi:MAG: aminotransferase class III-fold pyridoxal phosphate-dependent enzyme [Kouleothrix sp.]
MGAVAIHGRFGALPQASHGSTFGGGPLACAAARAALRELIERDSPRQAAEKGAYLLERLRALAGARARGARPGPADRPRAEGARTAVSGRAIERGVLALPAGPNVLRRFAAAGDLSTISSTMWWRRSLRCCAKIFDTMTPWHDD